MNELVETKTNSSPDGDEIEVHKISKSRSLPILKYETFMWVMIVSITTLSVADRFLWNVWPRQTYSIGAGSAGSDRLEGFKPGPWSVVLYDCLARISGRHAIVTYNFLLVTRLKSLECWLVGSFVSRNILDCRNIVHANNRLHNYNGIALCVLTLLHVWSILFPCVTHGYSAKVIPGVWEWPASERTPVKCSVEDVPGCWPGDANNNLKQMGLQVDDVFRMVEMTIFLMILMPLSVRWLASRWHAAIQLHRLINVVYFVDIVRRHSHPHSWILNTPIFLIYCADAFIWSNFWQRNDVPSVKRVRLSKHYMVLYWESRFAPSTTIAPHYSIVMKNHGTLEEKHIFTCFENRLDLPTLEPDDEKSLPKWDAACVIRVFRDQRKPQLSKVESHSHTMRMYQEKPEYIITGPSPGEMCLQLRSAYESPSKQILLVGSGSAVNYILDFLMWICSATKDRQLNKRKQIMVVYTTRDYHLFEWTATSLATVITEIHESISKSIQLKLSATGETDLFGEDGLSTSLSRSERTLGDSCHSVSFLKGRIDLNNEIGRDMKVFCQGSKLLKAAVKKKCIEANAAFFGGEGGH